MACHPWKGANYNLGNCPSHLSIANQFRTDKIWSVSIDRFALKIHYDEMFRVPAYHTHIHMYLLLSVSLFNRHHWRKNKKKFTQKLCLSKRSRRRGREQKKNRMIRMEKIWFFLFVINKWCLRKWKSNVTIKRTKKNIGLKYYCGIGSHECRFGRWTLSYTLRKIFFWQFVLLLVLFATHATW